MRGKTKQNLTQKQKALAKLTKFKKKIQNFTQFFLIQIQNFIHTLLQNYLFSAGKSLVFLFLLIN